MDWTTLIWRILCALTLTSGLIAILGLLDSLPPMMLAAVLAPGAVVILLLIVAAYADSIAASSMDGVTPERSASPSGPADE